MEKLFRYLTMIILGSASGIGVQAQTCAPAPVGLVSWYAADGNTLDSRSRNNGALQNGAGFAAGQNGQSFSFDGFDDAVEIPNASSLNPTAEVSFEAWVFPTANSGAPDVVSSILSKDAVSPFVPQFAFGRRNAAVCQWGGGISEGNFMFFLNGISGLPSDCAGFTDGNGNLPLNTWTHVAVTYDGSNVRAFINGVLTRQIAASGNLLTTTGTIHIGARSDADSISKWQGRIDETAIYNRALSAQEIASIHAAGTAGKCKPTATVSPSGQVGWFAGDGNANDVAGTNNSSLQNGASHTVGKVGQSFNFTAQNQSVGIPNNPALFPANSLSIEAWVNPSTYEGCSGNQYRIFHTIRSVLRGYVTFIDCPTRRFVGQIFDSNGTANTIASTANATFPTGVWTHFAMTWDGANLRIYVNGILDNTVATTISAIGTNSDPLRIGNEFDFGFKGQIDEVSLYNRALTDAEITSIFNAGIAGKLKQNATVDTSGLVSLWQGETNANDTRGANNGAFAGSYAAGRVGQAFNFSGTPGVVVPDSTSLNAQTFTLETWITAAPYACPNGAGNCQAFIIAKSGTTGQFGYEIGVQEAGKIRFSLNGAAGGADVLSNRTINDGRFHHITGAYDGDVMKIYVDGALDAQTSVATVINYQANSEFHIGSRGLTTGATAPFPGKIDEVALYNRALSSAEVRANYEAGNALSTVVGDARITFPTVSTAGTTQQISLDLSLLPALSTGATATGLTYDIATSAAFTGSPTVCFNLPSVTDSTIFGNLRILHLENNIWQNRTDLPSINFATKIICTNGLSSLSPFAVVTVVNTSANASISGRIRTANGGEIRNAAVKLLNTATGEVRFAQTGSFGRYQFADLTVGQSYVLSVSAKRYEFAVSTRMVNLNGDLTDADFVSEDR